MKLNKLIKKVNKENTPTEGWRAADTIKKDKPDDDKVYALTGGPNDRCISNRNLLRWSPR
jgi:hypothetical protein